MWPAEHPRSWLPGKGGIKPQACPPPSTAESGVGEHLAESVGLWPVWEVGNGKGWGQQPRTCLGSQHEGCVPFFVLLVHIQERTAAEQGHNTPEAVVACDHEACLGEGHLSPCAFLQELLGVSVPSKPTSDPEPLHPCEDPLLPTPFLLRTQAVGTDPKLSQDECGMVRTQTCPSCPRKRPGWLTLPLPSTWVASSGETPSSSLAWSWAESLRTQAQYRAPSLQAGVAVSVPEQDGASDMSSPPVCSGSSSSSLGTRR